MSKWKIEYAIRSFLKFKEDFDIENIKFHKDCNNNLAAVEVEALNNKEAIEEGNSQLKKVLNAMAVIVKQEIGYRINSIYQIKDHGILIEGTSHLEAKAYIIRPFPLDKIDNIAELVKLSEDPKVSWVLELFNSENPYTWVNLYRILEVIDSDKDVVDNGWSNRTEKNRFTHTADNPGASGKDARHGFRKYDPPRNPMTLDEAKEFICNIFDKWIKYKKDNLS